MEDKGSATTVAERIDALTARARREREAVAVDSEATVVADPLSSIAVNA